LKRYGCLMRRAVEFYSPWNRIHVPTLPLRPFPPFLLKGVISPW
jgi:hypothetical protein